MIALAEKDAVQAESDMAETVVLYQDALQADDFIQSELVLPGLQHGLAPTLQPVARRTFAFDLKACAAVGQQHEAGGARDNTCARSPEGFGGLPVEPSFGEFFEAFGPSHDGAITAAKQIVADTVTPGEPALAREICFFVEKVDGGYFWIVRYVQSAVRQQFVQVPCLARRDSG